MFKKDNKDNEQDNRTVNKPETFEDIYPGEVNSNEDISTPGPVYEGEVVENQDPKKKKRKKSKVRSIIEWILTGIFAAAFIFFAAAQIDGYVHKNEHEGQMVRFGYASFVVWTDSMEPDYPVDTAIITFLEDEQTIVNRFKNGETVDLTFINNVAFPEIHPSNPEYTNEIVSYKIMTHRLMEVIEQDGQYYFVTAGINPGGNLSNKSQYQVTQYKKLLGVVKSKSAFLGGLFSFISSVFGLLVFLLIPALYLAISSIIDILRTLKEAENAPQDANSNKNTSTSLDGISKKDKERLKQQMLDEMLNKKQNKDEKKDE